MPPLRTLGLATLVMASCAYAQGTPAEASSEMAMADYLALLEQISPAARDGAQAYLQAHEQRCGRSLTARQLRAAMSHGRGDPVLMAMIRTSQLRDRQALADLNKRVTCGVLP